MKVFVSERKKVCHNSMTHLFYLLLILSEYFIHDNGDGARHDFLEFLEDVLHGAAFFNLSCSL